jgi:hypothetical protein
MRPSFRPGAANPETGVTTMPDNNPTNAMLDVRDTATKGDGWTNVKASNGATYSYKYAGGNQPANNGSILYSVGRGNAAITLGFADTTDDRYEFASVSFTDDNAKQLSTEGNAPRIRIINDKCSEAIDAQYHVQVLDTTTEATIPCDPMIKNQ